MLRSVFFASFRDPNLQLTLVFSLTVRALLRNSSRVRPLPASRHGPLLNPPLAHVTRDAPLLPLTRTPRHGQHLPRRMDRRRQLLFAAEGAPPSAGVFPTRDAAGRRTRWRFGWRVRRSGSELCVWACAERAREYKCRGAREGGGVLQAGIEGGCAVLFCVVWAWDGVLSVEPA